MDTCCRLEFVSGYEASGWQGLGAPKNTPADVVEKLNKETNAALADLKMKARLLDLGGTPIPSIADDQRQKSLNRSGASSVYRTVCWMFLWPSQACSARVSWPAFARA